MKTRLIRKAEQENIQDDGIEVAKDLLDRIDNSVDDIKDAYYSLLDNLNAINNAYPNLYTELTQLIKLPNESNIKEVVQLKSDMDDAVKYLKDPDFLKGVIKKV